MNRPFSQTLTHLLYSVKFGRQREDIREPIKNALAKGEAFSLYKVSKATGIESYQVLTPISIGKTDTPWSFIISIPTDKVQEDSRALMMYVCIIAVIALLIIGAAIWSISTGIVNSIKGMVIGLKDISQGEGDLTLRLPENSKDEIGEMAKWFNIFIEKLQTIIRDISQTSSGINEINQNINQCSIAAEQVSKDISTVNEETAETRASSDQVSSSANQLNSMAT